LRGKDTDSAGRVNGTPDRSASTAILSNLLPAFVADLRVTFSLNSEGAVERVTLKAVSPLADFSYDYQDLLFSPARPKP
jgi:hypothetical protein